MPLLGLGSGRPGTAKSWDVSGLPSYLGAGKGFWCFCIGAVTLLLCLREVTEQQMLFGFW